MAHPGRKPESLLPPARGSGRRAQHAGPAVESPAVQLIWDVVSAIPRGQVSTYGDVARAAGLPGRARLVGHALRLAPRHVEIPWHRVLGAGGRIVFPKTSKDHKEQVRRLRADGVAVKEGRVDRDRLRPADEF